MELVTTRRCRPLSQTDASRYEIPSKAASFHRREYLRHWQPQNGGNGLGCQEEIAYTLTATDRHAVFSRQRVDIFKDDDVVSTQSARQHKDATDLIYQESVGALTGSGQHDPDNQHVSREKSVEERTFLIRRLTPLECERLQGFPDGWTDIPGASDSARYKALGNSVAIPCVEYILRGVALALRAAG